MSRWSSSLRESSRSSRFGQVSKPWSATSSGLTAVTETSSSIGSEVDMFASGGSFEGSNVRMSARPGTFVAARPAGLSEDMMNRLLVSAENAAQNLISEAQASLRTPMTRRDVRVVSQDNDVQVYECLPQIPVAREPPMMQQSTTSRRSVWDRLKFRRKRPAPLTQPKSSPQYVPQYSSATPRIFGVSKVNVTLDELIDILGHRSQHSSGLLHPGMAQSPMRHTLVDYLNEHASLRSYSMRPATSSSRLSSLSTMADPRDFLIVEYHRHFETPLEGLRGFVITFHSVNWNGCPPPQRGTTRGSMYRSGIVALESSSNPDQVDLFCVSEMNLKGDATYEDNYDVSYRRVLGTLSRIMFTIEERAKMLLSLDHTRVFQTASHKAQVDTCGSCKDRLGRVPPNTEPYMCRKCYMHVCGDCSAIWQRGRKDMRLCMECWADATLNRT